LLGRVYCHVDERKGLAYVDLPDLALLQTDFLDESSDQVFRARVVFSSDGDEDL
jgi:hypothetical protein